MLGVIDKEQLINVLKTEFCLPIDANEVEQKLDANKDGDITFQELKKLLRRWPNLKLFYNY